MSGENALTDEAEPGLCRAWPMLREAEWIFGRNRQGADVFQADLLSRWMDARN